MQQVTDTGSHINIAREASLLFTSLCLSTYLQNYYISYVNGLVFNGSFIHEKAAFSIFLLPSLQHTSRSQSNKMVIGISQEISKRSIKSCYVNFFLLRSIRIELSKINLFYLFFTFYIMNYCMVTFVVLWVNFDPCFQFHA